MEKGKGSSWFNQMIAVQEPLRYDEYGQAGAPGEDTEMSIFVTRG